jgi:hypothetical protein
MKFSLILAASASGLSIVNAMPSHLEERAQPKGFDISSYQPTINWAKVKSDGATFVMIKVCPSSLIFQTLIN